MIALILSVISMVIGLCAAFRWYQSNRETVSPMWLEVGAIEPVDPVIRAEQLSIALLAYSSKVGKLNRDAALLTAASIGIGGIAAVTSAIPI